MRGLLIGRVLLFFSFTFSDTDYECALVRWFVPVGDSPDPDTGIWVVQPEVKDDEPALDVLKIDSVARAAHLIGYPSTPGQSLTVSAIWSEWGLHDAVVLPVASAVDHTPMRPWLSRIHMLRVATHERGSWDPPLVHAQARARAAPSTTTPPPGARRRIYTGDESTRNEHRAQHMRKPRSRGGRRPVIPPLSFPLPSTSAHAQNAAGMAIPGRATRRRMRMRAVLRGHIDRTPQYTRAVLKPHPSRAWRGRISSGGCSCTGEPAAACTLSPTARKHERMRRREASAQRHVDVKAHRGREAPPLPTSNPFRFTGGEQPPDMDGRSASHPQRYCPRQYIRAEFPSRLQSAPSTHSHVLPVAGCCAAFHAVHAFGLSDFTDVTTLITPRASPPVARPQIMKIQLYFAAPCSHIDGLSAVVPDLRDFDGGRRSTWTRTQRRPSATLPPKRICERSGATPRKDPNSPSSPSSALPSWVTRPTGVTSPAAPHAPPPTPERPQCRPRLPRPQRGSYRVPSGPFGLSDSAGSRDIPRRSRRSFGVRVKGPDMDARLRRGVEGGRWERRRMAGGVYMMQGRVLSRSIPILHLCIVLATSSILPSCYISLRLSLSSPPLPTVCVVPALWRLPRSRPLSSLKISRRAAPPSSSPSHVGTMRRSDSSGSNGEEGRAARRIAVHTWTRRDVHGEGVDDDTGDAADPEADLPHTGTNEPSSSPLPLDLMRRRWDRSILRGDPVFETLWRVYGYCIEERRSTDRGAGRTGVSSVTLVRVGALRARTRTYGVRMDELHPPTHTCGFTPGRSSGGFGRVQRTPGYAGNSYGFAVVRCFLSRFFACRAPELRRARHIDMDAGAYQDASGEH
ncbi:hypothetical protein B0H17DRAFT_1206862 [Mycena rosella]|uniref:Uncharacterized protein n=1 Tax=Mycena rosella TaxID=1033263 RepID=A0AAD7G8L0_MYCRO|nr:hypothetical protein B0H17DRAFT_1206862 [Mycena rosella]